MPLVPFEHSDFLSLGIELELQLLSPHDFDLTRAASDLLGLVSRRAHAGDVKPEITQSMIEVSTSVHDGFASLVSELRTIRDDLLSAADLLNVVVCGGGSHPFQHWGDRSIVETPRFKRLSDLYGYLAKQFTVFGQHVHIGCRGGDEALYLLHSLSRYVPHFVALSASSPFYQGAETAFDSSRLNSVYAFPLSGRAPTLLEWSDFIAYFGKMEEFGLVESMKDFYWDIRPKPEYGTVEVRVCDTPLTVERAAVLAAYMQALSLYLLETRQHRPTDDDYLVYTYNRFLASRFGLEGTYVDPITADHGSLRDHILATLEAVTPYAAQLGSEPMVRYVRTLVEETGNDARWIRGRQVELHSFAGVMRGQAQLWRADDALLPALAIP